MASKEDLSEQLAVTQKLAAAVDQMAKNMSRVESSYETQITAVEKLTKSIETLSGKDLSGLNNTKLNNVQKEFKDTEKQVTGLTGRMKDLGIQMSKKFPASAAIGVAALSGFMQGIRNVIALGKGMTGFFSSFVSGAAGIAASIIAIPFKMFNALVDTAAAAGGGMNELAVALENLRKEMGDLKGPGTSAVIETSKSLKGFADTGLSTYRIFGTLAQRIEMMTKTAVAMGATFGVLKQEFKDNGGALLAFQKGLGISEEGMKALGDRAITTGKPMGKVMLDMTKQTLALGKAFDIDQKIIGKDMAKALQNVKHFGGLTVKEIGTASVYARKLGVELDKITGTLDAFETFDQAAENSAKLSQAFGVNIDAFKMMDAQNPAESLDMLRKSFRDAGVDASKFTRQQAKLLAQSSGLDEATVRQAFSAENYGTSLDDIKKKSETAAHKTMSQAEAMGKLADSIERMVKSGGAQSGGFFEQFTKGFFGGIQASKEFRNIIWNIKRSLQLVYFEGVRLGKAFVEMFPGVKAFLKGIADFFQPHKFKRLVGGVVNIFKDWMKGLSDPNGKASFGGLMDKLREKFFDFFDSNSASGKKMIDGFKTVIKTIGKVLAEGIKWAADNAVTGIKFIVDLLSGKVDLSAAGAAAGGGLGFLAEVLAPLGEALQHAWTVLKDPMMELVKTIFTKLKEFLMSDEVVNLIKPALPYIALALFGPAFGRALLSAATVSIFKSVGPMFKSLIKKAKTVSETAKEVSDKGGGAGGEMSKVGEVNKASGAAINADKGDKWGVQDAVKLGLKLVAIATALAIGGVEMAMAIWAMKKIMDNAGVKTTADVLPLLEVLGAMVVGAIPLMLALKIAKSVGDPASIVTGGAAVGLAVGIVGTIGAGLAWVMKKVASPAELDAAAGMMLKMSLVFLAMVPLLAASFMIGSVILSSGGLALIPMAAGFAAIAVAVGLVATAAVGVVHALSSVKIEAGFQTKIDAFLGIMKAIQSFADTMVSLVGMMAPTFTELLTGKTSSFSEKVDKTVDLIGSMIGSKGSGTGIIGLVELVVGKIKELKIGGPELAESAKLFTTILSAITQVAQAMTPPPAYFDAQTNFINVLDPTVGSGIGETMKQYMQVMTASMKTIIDQVVETVKVLARVEIPNIEQAKATADLISSIANIMKVLTPDAETIKSMQDSGTQASYLWGLLKYDSKNKGVSADDINKIISKKAESMKSIVDSITTGPLKTVLSAAAGLSKEQLGSVKVITDILKMVTDLAVGMSSATPKGKIELSNVQGSTINFAPRMAVMLDDMKEKLPPLIGTLANLVKGFPVNIDKKFMKNLEVAKTLFGFITELPKVMSDLSSASPEGATKANVSDSYVESIAFMSTFLHRIMAGGGAFGTSGNPLPDLIKNIELVGKLMPGNIGVNLTATSNKLTKLFKALAESQDGFKSFAEAPKVADGAIASSLLAISEMVDTANKLNQSLSKLPTINIPAALTPLAKGLGIGGKFNYSIKNNDVVVNVAMTVTMKTDDVESVMINRANSTIRQRLDYLSDKSGASPTIMPKDTSYAGSTPALGGGNQGSGG